MTRTHPTSGKAAVNDSPVMLRSGVAIDRARYRRDVAAFARRLSARPGRRWGLYCDDSYAFAVALAALAEQDREAVLLPNFQPGFVHSIASQLDAVATDRDDRIESLPVERVDIEALSASTAEPVRSVFDRAGTRIAFFTSGSTGQPKPVRKTLAQLKTEVDALERLWGPAVQDSVVLSTVSHQHIYGFLFKVLWPLLSGRTTDAATYQYPEFLLQQILQYRKTALISSPAHLKRMPELIDLSLARGRVRAVFSSGGPLSNGSAVAVHRQLRVPVIEVFGSTETGGIAHRAQTEPNVAPAWTPLPGVRVDKTGDGRLRILSPYEGSNDWYCMEDLVELQSDNRFVNHGRADKIVKVEEKRLSLNELENRVVESRLAIEAAAVVVEGRRSQVAVAAVASAAGRAILDRDGKKALCRRLRTYLENHFETVVLPKKWRFLDELPRNSQGKLTQTTIKSLFMPHKESGQSSPVIEPVVEIRERDQDRVVLNLRIPDDLLYFQGHFPDQPVLPGVVQLDWAQTLARRYLDVPDGFLSMEAIKFHEFIEPGETVTLSMRYDRAKHKLHFNYTSPKGRHSSGRLLLG